MNLDQYNAETICRSMGIPHFSDPRDLPPDHRGIRLVLKPSFTPEVCVTIVEYGGSITADVATLYEMLWHQPHPCTLPNIHEHFTIDKDVFSAILANFTNAIDEMRNQQRPIIICDGMSFDVAWRNGSRIDQLGTHVTGAAVEEFVRHLITTTFESVHDDVLRKNLAQCGPYLALHLPLIEVPKELPSNVRIGIFGTPDDRDDLVRQLANKRKDA